MKLLLAICKNLKAQENQSCFNFGNRCYDSHESGRQPCYPNIPESLKSFSNLCFPDPLMPSQTRGACGCGGGGTKTVAPLGVAISSLHPAVLRWRLLSK